MGQDMSQLVERARGLGRCRRTALVICGVMLHWLVGLSCERLQLPKLQQMRVGGGRKAGGLQMA